MNFVGLPFATLLQIGAVAGGLVVVLYILKLRRRPVAVPFSHIWERILRDKDATSLFSQLKRLLSLLLQLLVLLLLLVALGDPRTATNLVEGRNVVVLFDASASMAANDGDPTRLDEGKRELREIVRGLSASDRMLIAQMDASITPLSTLTGEISDLEEAVDSVQVSDARADLERGLRFATDTLRGLPKAEIVVVSDGALQSADDRVSVPLGDITLSYIPVGERDRNAAITGFSVRRYPLDKSRYEVMLEVTNASEDPLDIELSLFGDGRLTDISRLKLKPGEKLPRFYPNLSGASETLEARIALADGTRDDLAADDTAFALLPERQRSRVQAVTPGNMYLEAALFLDEYLDVTFIAPEQYPAEGAFDVTIFDGDAPAVAEGSGDVLYLNPSGDNLPFELGDELLDGDTQIPLGFDEIEYEHPIVRYTLLGRVNVSRATALKPGKDDRVVGASYRGPLLIEGTRDGRKFVAMGFDIRESDLPLRNSWPLFLLNVINSFVEEDVDYISSFRTGRVWRIPAPANTPIATLTLPSGEEHTVPVKEGRAVYLGQDAGFYELTADGVKEGEETRFAANLMDPNESYIAPSPELSVGDVTAGQVSGFTIGVRRELWMYFLLAVLAISAIEWLTYHRRITV